MTKYEKIKNSTLNEMAEFLCEEFLDKDATEAEYGCEVCPASKYCCERHNGMKKYLEEEYKDE